LWFVPFAFLNLISPFVSIFYGYTGITMERIDSKASEIESAATTV